MLTCYLSAKIDLAEGQMNVLTIVLGILISFEAFAATPKLVCPKACCRTLVRQNARLRMQIKRLTPPPPPKMSYIIRSVDDPSDGPVPKIEPVD